MKAIKEKELELKLRELQNIKDSFPKMADIEKAVGDKLGGKSIHTVRSANRLKDVYKLEEVIEKFKEVRTEWAKNILK